MAFELKDNSGSLWVNERKTTDNQTADTPHARDVVLCSGVRGASHSILSPGRFLRTARILAARGFLTEPKRLPGGFYSASLTDAGVGNN